jgi:hypothetical protein
VANTIASEGKTGLPYFAIKLNVCHIVLYLVRIYAEYRIHVRVLVPIKIMYDGVKQGKQYSENLFFIFKRTYLLKVSITCPSLSTIALTDSVEPRCASEASILSTDYEITVHRYAAR